MQQRAHHGLAPDHAEEVDAGMRAQRHDGEPLGRVRPAGLTQHAGVVGEHRAGLVDIVDDPVAQHRVGRRIQGRHGARHEVGPDPVVVRQPFEQAAAALLPDAVAVGGSAQVALVAKVADAPVGSGQVLSDLGGAVGGRIVGRRSARGRQRSGPGPTASRARDSFRHYRPGCRCSHVAMEKLLGTQGRAGDRRRRTPDRSLNQRNQFSTRRTAREEDTQMPQSAMCSPTSEHTTGYSTPVEKRSGLEPG